MCIVIQHLAEEAKGRRALKKAGRDTQQGPVKIQRYESSMMLSFFVQLRLLLEQPVMFAGGCELRHHTLWNILSFIYFLRDYIKGCFTTAMVCTDP